MSELTIAVDFDGVLHPYTEGWVGIVPADEVPIRGALDFLAALHAEYRVVVFSTRCREPEGREAVWDWLQKWDLAVLVDEVTAEKPGAIAYVDDRAVSFDGPESWVRVAHDIKKLRYAGPWNKRRETPA